MSTLCAGLAILGLCVPLPGESRARVEASGWTVVHETSTPLEWGATSTLASNGYRLLVSMYGRGDSVIAVHLEELAPDPEAPPSTKGSNLSRLDLALSPLCPRNREACLHGQTAFKRAACDGGWMLLAPSESTAKTRAGCSEAERSRKRFPAAMKAALQPDEAKVDGGSR